MESTDKPQSGSRRARNALILAEPAAKSTATRERPDSVDHDRPTCFIAYTVKGYGLPLAGHKDNHAGILTPDQLAGFQKDLGIQEGDELPEPLGPRLVDEPANNRHPAPNREGTVLLFDSAHRCSAG